eukprot:evm.model.scf_2425.1 EVM.evm.TU.scf_2425.1   scf_2425:15036-16215(+)
MHEAGLIHRDIKLENIFVDGDGNAKLVDFGLTMSRHEEKAVCLVGTIEYMAPEVVNLPLPEKVISGDVSVKDINPVDEKIDIWALGVTCYELITGIC